MLDFTNGISARQGVMERMKCNFAGILPEIPMYRTKASAEWAGVPRRPASSWRLAGSNVNKRPSRPFGIEQ
jgi:hypothetical protein